MVISTYAACMFPTLRIIQNLQTRENKMEKYGWKTARCYDTEDKWSLIGLMSESNAPTLCTILTQLNTVRFMTDVPAESALHTIITTA